MLGKIIEYEMRMEFSKAERPGDNGSRLVYMTAEVAEEYLNMLPSDYQKQAKLLFYSGSFSSFMIEGCKLGRQNLVEFEELLTDQNLFKFEDAANRCDFILKVFENNASVLRSNRKPIKAEYSTLMAQAEYTLGTYGCENNPGYNKYVVEYISKFYWAGEVTAQDDNYFANQVGDLYVNLELEFIRNYMQARINGTSVNLSLIQALEICQDLSLQAISKIYQNQDPIEIRHFQVSQTIMYDLAIFLLDCDYYVYQLQGYSSSTNDFNVFQKIKIFLDAQNFNLIFGQIVDDQVNFDAVPIWVQALGMGETEVESLRGTFSRIEMVYNAYFYPVLTILFNGESLIDQFNEIETFTWNSFMQIFPYEGDVILRQNDEKFYVMILEARLGIRLAFKLLKHFVMTEEKYQNLCTIGRVVKVVQEFYLDHQNLLVNIYDYFTVYYHPDLTFAEFVKKHGFYKYYPFADPTMPVPDNYQFRAHFYVVIYENSSVPYEDHPDKTQNGQRMFDLISSWLGDLDRILNSEQEMRNVQIENNMMEGSGTKVKIEYSSQKQLVKYMQKMVDIYELEDEKMYFEKLINMICQKGIISNYCPRGADPYVVNQEVLLINYEIRMNLNNQILWQSGQVFMQPWFVTVINHIENSKLYSLQMTYKAVSNGFRDPNWRENPEHLATMLVVKFAFELLSMESLKKSCVDFVTGFVDDNEQDLLTWLDLAVIDREKEDYMEPAYIYEEYYPEKVMSGMRRKRQVSDQSRQVMEACKNLLKQLKQTEIQMLKYRETNLYSFSELDFLLYEYASNTYFYDEFLNSVLKLMVEPAPYLSPESQEMQCYVFKNMMTLNFGLQRFLITEFLSSKSQQVSEELYEEYMTMSESERSLEINPVRTFQTRVDDLLEIMESVDMSYLMTHFPSAMIYPQANVEIMII